MDDKMDSTDSTEPNLAYCFKEWDIKESDIQPVDKLLNTNSGDFDATQTKSEFDVRIKSFNMGPYVNKASSSIRFSQSDGINFKLIGSYKNIKFGFEIKFFLTWLVSLLYNRLNERARLSRGNHSGSGRHNLLRCAIPRSVLFFAHENMQGVGRFILRRLEDHELV